MKVIVNSIILVCTCSFLISCKEDIEPAALRNGSEFLPVSIGNEWIYNQTEIAYEISGFDTTTTQVRERVVAMDSSLTDVVNFTVEQSTRLSDAVNWQVASHYVVKVSNNWILTQKENKISTTLDLPVVLDRTWDYYSHSNAASTIVRYSSNDDAFSQSFDPIFDEVGDEVFVIISDIEQNIVNQNQQYERYIAGVGLVEKKSIILEFCTVNCQTSGQINTGRFFNKKLISYNVAD